MKLNFNLAAVLLFVTLMLSNCYNTNENLSARQTEPSCEDLTNWKNDGTKHNTYLAQAVQKAIFSSPNFWLKTIKTYTSYSKTFRYKT